MISDVICGTVARIAYEFTIHSAEGADYDHIPVYFLNRKPDPQGFQFRTDHIEQCGSDAPCREVRRISVSQAFLLSIEFQQTSYRVFRFYQAHACSYQ